MPSFKGVAFNFLSGKVLRVCMPFFLIAFYFTSLILAAEFIFFALLSLGQTIFYGLALYVHYKTKQGEKDQSMNKLFAVIYYFASGYWFSLVGMLQYLAKSKTFKV